MKKRWFAFGLILLTVFNFSALGKVGYDRWCHNRACSLPCAGADRGYCMRQQLNLTDDQIARMKASREMSDPKIELLSQHMREKRTDLIGELMAGKPDSARIEGILLHVDSLQGMLQREVVQHLLRGKEILAPEQEEKFYMMVLEQFSAGMKQEQHRVMNNQSSTNHERR